MGKKGEQDSFGPTWYDVMELTDHLEKKYSVRLHVRLEVVHGVRNTKHLRCAVIAMPDIAILGIQGYGKGFNNGARTVPAAIYAALMRGDELMASRVERGAHPLQEELPF